ncbi:hypothetical protein HanHA300_Chr14g0522341 [Helianthus annuus]|uniref:Uncharacterized protein n=1 Tax=Helianthus annuus TaxID=4232 RepID=A0A251SGQ4_HELAN|nr:hypothetical protein HanHA300_Chr14g0522341 [Helianthus annuus]KAJ0468395.1 hypothetical protein HanIR_Chr14g0696141 [Helianthus annuus]KAJ0485565.1 hypothetical protein HanHA89_Chr14g0569761 [Helianthus annuus]KAJ0656117.1 hypothetical protein HanLR1_Chr14g0532151 [Helianthus annuus]
MMDGTFSFNSFQCFYFLYFEFRGLYHATQPHMSIITIPRAPLLNHESWLHTLS